MTQMKKEETCRGLLKAVAALAAVALLQSGTVSGAGFIEEAYAADKGITGLGTGAITNPVVPADQSSAWSGSYVYYGKYDGTSPTKYRVLDKEATKFGGNTLFLDCDSVLYDAKFDEDGSANEEGHNPNEWAYSDVKTGLSGNKFLEKSGNFSDAEKDAMALSTVGAHDLVKATDDNIDEEGKVTDWSWKNYVKYVALNNEKVFLLDAEDASNNKYGYSMTDKFAANRRKNYNGSASFWWLRSAFSNNGLKAGFVYVDGGLGDYDLECVTGLLGVSPAFNVNLESVIFTSLISGTSNEYKLTLSDNKIKIAARDVTRSGDIVTVPYTITGDNAANATQVSVLITDSPYSAGTALTSSYKYEKLNVEPWGTAGTGTFTIPDEYKNKTWGTDYHVYILAEDVNGEKETDYASAPVSIMPIVSATAGYEGTYDGQAHGITVSVTDPADGATIKYGNAADLDSSPTITYVSESPKTVYYKLSALGYKDTFGSAAININKKEVSLNWSNTSLTYNGSEQAPTATAEGLVNNDSCTVAVSGATDAGTYTATATGLSNGNYKLPGSGTTTEFTINKAAYGGEKTAYTTLNPSEPVTDGTIILPALPEGAVYAASGAVSGDTDLIFSHSVAGTDLTFSSTEQTDLKTAVITIAATGAKNYLDYEVKVTITSKKDADISIKDGDRTATYGDDGFTLEGEVTYPGDNGHWTFTSGNPDIAKVDPKTGEVSFGSAGETAITAVYESDTSYGEKNINITVEKAAALVTKAPEAKAGLVYNGEAQELVSPGEADGGEIRYALTKDDNEPEDSAYSASIPTATEAGTYMVWYRVIGDKNHYDSDVQSIKISIAEKPDEEEKQDKVPLTPYTDAYESYASPEDNFAARVPDATDGTGGSIKNQELDFTNVLTSGVDPKALKMTVIAGSKFKTTGKVTDKGAVQTTGGVKAKFSKKDSTAIITCKSDGTATFTMDDGNTYSVAFTVEKPKAVKAAKTMATGGTAVTKTLMDLFGTHINSGKLTIVKQKHSQATVSDNMLIVNPAEKDSIKIHYQYLNKKYKMSIRIK